MKILITGGCGFVGSNLAVLFKHYYNASEVYCLDNLSRRGSEINLQKVLAAGGQFVHGDVRVKTDFDRMADHEIRENIQSLKTLMIKLYKRNPSELKKSTSEDPEKMVNWVFNGNHNWNFEAINNAQGTDAIYLTFSEDYKGDKVLPFIVGIYTMLIQAHGGKKEFYLFDSVDPQMLYNASRNIDTAVWKLSNTKDSSGKFFLLANEINEKESNLSFEREFGKIIGRTDFLAFTLSEKTERSITRIIQNVTTGLLIPF